MDERRCYSCHQNSFADPLERHHVYGGNPNDRKRSEKYGAMVYLCGDKCHRNGRHAVHQDGDVMRGLRREFQVKIMREQGWTEDDFRREFGKSYL